MWRARRFPTAGVAWTDFVIVYFQTTELPTVSGTLEDLGAALFLTALGVCWLASTGYESTLSADSSTSRSAVERFFLNSALSFFVGWMWIASGRDLTILCANGVRPYFDRGRFSCIQWSDGLNKQTICGDRTAEEAVYATAAALQTAISTLLTFALLRFSQYSGAVGRHAAATPDVAASSWLRRAASRRSLRLEVVVDLSASRAVTA